MSIDFFYQFYFEYPLESAISRREPGMLSIHGIHRKVALNDLSLIQADTTTFHKRFQCGTLLKFSDTSDRPRASVTGAVWSHRFRQKFRLYYCIISPP